ncbi:MAG: homocitrate synthase [Oscillospiraceae bacterium]|nr:homocitrate synthase [Oscillospiraceae bacterium]
MKAKRYLLDSTLRDGEQSPSVTLNAKQKIKIASLLDNAGIYQIEAGIPAISTEEKNTISKILENRKNAVISVWSRLIPEDIQQATEVFPDMVHISIPVSYVHIYAKLRKNKSWLINQLYACLEVIQKNKVKFSVGFEDAFRSEFSFMAKVADILTEYGVSRIRIADTVGIANPSTCRNLINEFSALTENKIELGFHAHNDLGMAVANSVETAKAGCLYVDVTAGGIGERAGNCNLAQLVYSSSDIFDWGLNAYQAFELQKNIIEIIKER